MKTEYTATERIAVPATVADLARRRTRGLLKAAIFGPNALEMLMMSCYLQGIEDAMSVTHSQVNVSVKSETTP